MKACKMEHDSGSSGCSGSSGYTMTFLSRRYTIVLSVNYGIREFMKFDNTAAIMSMYQE